MTMVTTTTWLLIYLAVGMVYMRWITLMFLARSDERVRLSSILFNMLLWPVSMAFLATIYVGFVVAHRRRPKPEDAEKELEDAS